MIDENIDTRMAMAQVLWELGPENADAFMAKINSAKNNVEAYKICMETLKDIWG